MTSITHHSLVALVSGASGGFGSAIAQLLSDAGYVVFGTSRNGTGLPTGCKGLSLDVGNQISVDDCLQQFALRSTRLDLLVNNAGIARVGACEETSVAETQETFETNFFGTIRLTQACIEQTLPRSTRSLAGEQSPSARARRGPGKTPELACSDI